MYTYSVKNQAMTYTRNIYNQHSPIIIVISRTPLNDAYDYSSIIQNQCPIIKKKFGKY